MIAEKKYAERLSENSRLVEMLQTLSKTESKSFLRFLQSPYHNSNKAVLDFYSILRNYYPHFSPKNLSKTEIYQQVFGRKYDEAQMTQLMTKTCQALENFFAAEELRNDKLLITKLKRDAFQERKLTKQYAKASKQIQTQLEQTSDTDSRIYLERFLLNENLLYSGKLKQEEKEKYISNSLTHLDQWFVWQKLRLSCLALNESRVKSVNFDLYLLDKILDDKKVINQVGGILTFYEKIVFLQKEGDGIDIEELVSWLDGALENMNKKERRDVIIIFLNILFRRHREGEKSLIQLILEVYKIGLQKEAFIRNGAISHQTFINIAVAAIGCKQFEWAEQFIETFQHYVPDFRSDSVHLAYGYLYYNKELELDDEKRNYTKAINSLMKVLSTKSFFQYRARSLQIRVYYELSVQENDNFEHVQYFAKAFRKHIRRKSKLNQRKAKTFLNFISCTEKIVTIRMSEKSKRLEKVKKLKEEIEKINPVFAHDWITEKILEVEKSTKHKS